jgi:ISXO2-like transposase domain
MAENSSSGATLPIAGSAPSPPDALVTDDWPAYQDLPGVRHNTITLGPMAAHIALSWIHRLFSNLKCWGVGVHHGLRKPNLQHSLDKFVSRFKSAPDTACRLRYSARHQHRTTQSCLTCNNI